MKISWEPTTKRTEVSCNVVWTSSIHLDEFLSSLQAGFDVKYIYHNFYLKATECKRGTENADATTCGFRNDQPLVDCVICYKISAGEIDEKPKPYLNCMYRRLLSKENKREREIGCFRVGFGHLTPTPVASTGSQRTAGGETSFEI